MLYFSASIVSVAIDTSMAVKVFSTIFCLQLHIAFIL